MEFEEIVIETDRLDFPALTAGRGPIVLCWHGFPDHPATFGPVVEHVVAAGRRVVAPFLRGHRGAGGRGVARAAAAGRNDGGAAAGYPAGLVRRSRAAETVLAVKTEAPGPVPLLVLAGDEDGCIPPAGFATAQEALAPGSRVETIRAAGHFMHLDRPDAVATAILDWLDEP